MIEIFTSGFFVSKPHEIGGGGAIILSEREEIGRVKQVFRAGELSSSIAVELAILAEALEKARDKGHGGEEVLVRTGYASLADLCRGRSPRATPDVGECVARLADIARDFTEVRAVVSPGWVTARPHDLALRAVLDLFRTHPPGGELLGSPPEQG